MPSAADHFRFAAAVLVGLGLKTNEQPAFCPKLGLERELVFIGTQGPDPFFFYGMVPWRRRSNAELTRSFARELHQMDPASYLLAIARGVKNQLNSDAVELSKDDTNFSLSHQPKFGQALLFGFLLHYLLDRTIHPYVFYESGFDAAGGLSGSWAVAHADYETLMAAVAGQADKQGRGCPRRIFAVSDEALRLADQLIAAVFPVTCPVGRFIDSWQDMATVLKTLWDPFYLKRPLLRLILGADSQGAAMIQPRQPKPADNIDYLNEQNRLWRHPAKGTESQASVAELTAMAAATVGPAWKRLLAAAGLELGPDCELPAAAALAECQSYLGAINHDGLGPGQRMRFKRL